MRPLLLCGLVLAASLPLTVVANPALAPPKATSNLCVAGEQDVYSCQLVDARFVSLCKAGKRLTFRLGRPGEPLDVVYPSAPTQKGVFEKIEDEMPPSVMVRFTAPDGSIYGVTGMTQVPSELAGSLHVSHKNLRQPKEIACKPTARNLYRQLDRLSIQR